MAYIAITVKHRFQIAHLIKIKVLTYTSYKKHSERYTEVYDVISVSDFQI